MSDAAARAYLRWPEGFVPFPSTECDQPIHRRFERQASRRADAVAIRTPSRDVSYAELNAAANRAARRLIPTTKPDSQPVALLLDQGYASIVWTLAILKAGRAYAPLDQRLPELVLGAMIDYLRPGALIVAAGTAKRYRSLAAERCPVIEVDDSPERSDPSLRSEDLDLRVGPESLACVFHTSGSTGTPKGVADTHRNVLHNVMRYTNSLGFSPGDTLSLVQNPSFSGTVSSLFGALSNGAAVAPYDLRHHGLPAMSGWLSRSRVSVFHAVPSIFRQLADPVERFPDVRLIRLEGDAATARDLRHFRGNFQETCTLVNGLGATECGIVRQFFVGRATGHDAMKRVPVGYPVAQMEVCIVDDRGRRLPSGSSGEITVESRFLASGYWRNPALTAERFEALPGGLRRYRSGDLGRMDDDGCLTHLGRIGHGIRIAGLLVDTAEIELLLAELPGVAQAVVHDFDDATGERRLCAYVVAEGGARLNVDSLRASLSGRLAPRDIPSAFVFLEALPLTTDLKVDRNGLPKPGRLRPSLANNRVAPSTETERRLADIWSVVLGIDDVGVTDSFFDLGGDSLRAAEIARRFSERYGGAVDIAGLFEYATIRALAGAVESIR
ncbi:MAG: non-ribosomal peptide synthetase [Betaproteobacteria bacterium]